MKVTKSAPSGISLAILLGTSVCPRAPELPELSQCANSAKDLHELLVGSLKFEIDNVKSLFDSDHAAGDQLDEIENWINERMIAQGSKYNNGKNNLILYYTGHGGFTTNDRAYFLATRKTRTGNEGSTSIRFADLALCINRAAKSFRRFILLDCCFAAAGRDVPQAGVGQLMMNRTKEEFPTRGTAYLCSSSAKHVSIAPNGERYTMFSGALIDVLKSGVPTQARHLSLLEVSNRVRSHIQDKFHTEAVRPELHETDQDEGSVATIPLFFNVASTSNNGQNLGIQSKKRFRNVLDIVSKASKGRELAALQQQHELMRSSLRFFLRSNPEFLYARTNESKINLDAPSSWTPGSLGLESYGIYGADNGSFCFDILDFDDACLAPCTWDLIYALVDIIITSDSLDYREYTVDFVSMFINAFRQTILSGRPQDIIRDDAFPSTLSGFLRRNSSRAIKNYFDRRVSYKDERPIIRVDNDRAAPLARSIKSDITKLFCEIAKHNIKYIGDDFEVLDVAHRLVGIRGLGLPRFLILVRSHTRPDFQLFELRNIQQSSLTPWVSCSQPTWTSEAVRVTSIEKKLHHFKSDVSIPITLYNNPYALHQLRPETDRVAVSRQAGDPKSFAELMGICGSVFASALLRGAKWRGANDIAALIDFGKRDDWERPLFREALALTNSVQESWIKFRASFFAGLLDRPASGLLDLSQSLTD